MELLLQIVGEFLLQAVGEALFELGFHALGEPFRKPPTPWLAAIGYALFGAAFGGLSLLLFPAHMIPVGAWRVVNLLLTPLGAGAVMAMLGAWRARRGDPVFRIDRFSYGFLFALALALIRFQFAQ